MNELEKALLAESVGSETPRLCLRSMTRVDTGRWLRKSPLWLCIMEKELVLLSVSRRKLLERAPLSACASSYYAHATGELVIEPCEDLEFRRVRFRPSQALEVLPMLKRTS